MLDGLSIRGAVPLPDILAAARRHLERLEAGDRGDAAAGVDALRFNLLLSGPPGCGKTEFVRYLGERLGREVRPLGASDLLGSLLGETEHRIRAAFEGAARDGAVLFFKRTFFERFFRTPLTPAEEEELDAIPRLCPGDFRTVRQSLWYLPGGADNARRLAALREESDQKERLGAASFDGPERRPVGF